MNESRASAGCEHCGLPLARSARRFCCSGCYVASHLLARGADDVAGGGDRRPSDRLLARLVLSAFLAMGVMVFSLSLYGLDGRVDEGAAVALQGLTRLGALVLSLPVLFLLGVPLVDAVVSLRRWLSADALILAGTAAAWCVSLWNTFTDGGKVYYETATMVLVLVTLGRWLEVRARERARERLGVLASDRNPVAVRVDAAGEQDVAPDDLRVGDCVRVRPGEEVPVDGTVVEGRSFLDVADLTGEETPTAAACGERVLAGSRALDGTLLVRAEAVRGGRLRDEIERLLAEALTARPSLVRSADRVAALFLPVVLILASAAGVWRGWRLGPEEGLLTALSVVLIACPCALGLATPLAFWVALGEAWRRGVLVRGGDVLERLARTRSVFFDKTGTLTTGAPRLVEIDAAPPWDAARILQLAAALEQGSEHPIGQALRAAWRERDAREALPPVVDFQAEPGVGVCGSIDGCRYRLRSAAEAESQPAAQTRVVLEGRQGVMATLRLQGELRAEAPAVLRALASRRLHSAVLTGDGAGPAQALSEELQVPVEARLLPADKARRIAAAGPRGTLFVGDGLNDAVALAAADVGATVRGASAKSLESASVNLLREGLGELPGLIDLARSAVWTARTNLLWAFGYNAIGLWLAATGRLSPVFAASAMVISSLLVVLNSARLAGQRADARAVRSTLGAVSRPRREALLESAG